MCIYIYIFHSTVMAMVASVDILLFSLAFYVRVHSHNLMIKLLANKGAQARWVNGATCVGAAPAGGDTPGSCHKTLTERSLAMDTTKSLHPP